MEDLKTITVCDNPYMANLVQDALKENGIACMEVDQTVVGAPGGYGPFPGYAIRVYAKDEERAKAIVDEIMTNRDIVEDDIQ